MVESQKNLTNTHIIKYITKMNLIKIKRASNWLKITCFYVIILVMLRRKMELTIKEKKEGVYLKNIKKKQKDRQEKTSASFNWYPRTYG